MTATFDPKLTGPIDRIRQYLGDTNTSKPQIVDDTIQAYLNTGLSELRVAAQLARDLAARYAAMVDTEHDNMQTMGSQLRQHYTELAADLERLAAQVTGPATAAGGFGGILVTGIGDCRGPLDSWCPPWAR